MLNSQLVVHPDPQLLALVCFRIGLEVSDSPDPFVKNSITIAAGRQAPESILGVMMVKNGAFFA